ncbi:unnamed protein product [Psylliodes chrysocephalus]|uniref:C2H2-type domain-containing protein n=1 Tax=Psylliodes chrysocephalus TaxID=3402493 RepID=A0A9P0CC60_9CUCU|nr:unnamed protein product [Psylliodes chrysocephala]
MDSLLILKKTVRVVICKYCSKPLINSKTYFKHLKSHFRCGLCKIKFVSENRYLNHRCKFKEYCHVRLEIM